MNHISGIITTLNEENNILDAITSLQKVCDEVIVVDSESTDRTREIAESAGAKVYVQKYLGDGIQRNFALQFVKNSWVLSLDADERLTQELVNKIEETDLDNITYDGIAFRRRNYIGSRWIKSCGWYPNYLIRLYRHDKIRFTDVKQHATILSDNYKRWDVDLIHYTYKNLGELYAKPGRNFSTRGAKILYLKGKKVTALSPIYHSIVAFVKNYFFYGGIFDGIDGLTISKSIATTSYLKYAKLLEYYRDPQVLANEDFDEIW